MTVMTYSETLEYIHSVSWLGSRPGLERISELCALLGHPEDKLKFIHVAGTNGKGSFCSMLSSVLLRAGYKVGLFTSPYVKCFNERMQINGEMISEDDLARVTSRVRPAAESMAQHPTEFELITAVAFEYFAEAECDYVILEAGLGGRLDSTNVIKSSVLSVITGVDLDHTAILGDTVEKIAAEKAGIIKRGCPVILGDGVESAKEVIKQTAAALEAPLCEVDYGKLSEVCFSLDGTDFAFDGVRYTLGLLGEYQTRNAAVVLTAVDALRRAGLHVSSDAVRSGLESARWPARFERLSNTPTVIYDGAHNPQGIDAAVRNIKLLLGEEKVCALVGVMSDKDHSVMTKALSHIASRVFTVTPDNPRAMDASLLAEEFRAEGVNAVSFATVEEGVRAAMESALHTGTPLVCLGSLYMYAEVSAAVEKYSNDGKER